MLCPSGRLLLCPSGFEVNNVSIAYSWNTTPEERGRTYPCDGLIAGKTVALYRAIDVGAPAALVYRWLCQLRVAPYSYDWIDNAGRRSPQERTHALEELRVGQPVMRIFGLVSFERDRHITIRLRDRRLARRIFGEVAMTYAVRPLAEWSSRITAKVIVRHPAPPLGWLLRAFLPWGDLIMMRKQLMNLKRLAEREAAV